MLTETHKHHIQTGSPLQACSLTGRVKSHFFISVSDSLAWKKIVLILVALVQMQRADAKEEEDSDANMAGSTRWLGP